MNNKPEVATVARKIVVWQEFETELHSREHEIATLLPPNVNKDRFLASAVAAVKQTPQLLTASMRTLFAAITKSAQDGLLPDGREGVITVYKTYSKADDSTEMVAQWNPMVGGLRKRARELDGILIDAQCVHENDDFVWHQGDKPSIEHTPAKLGTPRGEMYGAYAIFKREDGTILHREVMDSVSIEKTRSQSKAKDSLMWTTFVSEGYRKTVIRRGIKSVPVSDKLASIVRSDDDQFDFEAPIELEATVMPPRPVRSEFERKPNDKLAASHSPRPRAGTPAQEVRPTEAHEPEPDTPASKPIEPQEANATPAEEVQIDRKAEMRQQQEEWYGEQKAALAAITRVRDVAALTDMVEPQLFPEQEKEWADLCTAKSAAIMAGAKTKK